MTKANKVLISEGVFIWLAGLFGVQSSGLTFIARPGSEALHLLTDSVLPTPYIIEPILQRRKQPPRERLACSGVQSQDSDPEYLVPARPLKSPSVRGLGEFSNSWHIGCKHPLDEEHRECSSLVLVRLGQSL